MTQDKELLLKDLCARLPYGVIVDTPKGKGHVCDINLTIFGTEIGVNVNPTVRDTFNINDVKPYLFPLSSMTEEQKYNNPIGFVQMGTILANRDWERITIKHTELYKLIDWFNKKHFDWRGLIEKGLAIDATGLNIY